MITVCSVDGAEVLGYAAGGERVRFLLTRVGGEPAAVNDAWRFGAVLLEAGALSNAQLRDAAGLLGDLNEAWFGYRSGEAGRASPGEPRAGFDPAQTTLRQTAVYRLTGSDGVWAAHGPACSRVVRPLPVDSEASRRRPWARGSNA